jgi:hypothetical protein
MIAEELTEYLIASQLMFRSDKYWIASGEASCKDSSSSSNAWIGQSSIIWSMV